MLKERIDQDLKAALLAGDKVLVTTLRGLKSTILYAEVAKGSRDVGLPDDEIVSLFAKEVKKRQESAELYRQGGSEDKAAAELAEKSVIEAYLPPQLSDSELREMVAVAVKESGLSGQQAMGQIIGLVKQKAGASVDGGRIAAMVKEALTA